MSDHFLKHICGHARALAHVCALCTRVRPVSHSLPSDN